MDEPLDAAQVDEDAELADLRDVPLQALTRRERAEQLLGGLALLTLEDTAPADDQAVRAALDRRHGELEALTQHLVGVLERTERHAAGGAEHADALDQDVEATAVEAEHQAANTTALLSRVDDALLGGGDVDNAVDQHHVAALGDRADATAEDGAEGRSRRCLGLGLGGALLVVSLLVLSLLLVGGLVVVLLDGLLDARVLRVRVRQGHSGLAQRSGLGRVRGDLGCDGDRLDRADRGLTGLGSGLAGG